MLDLKELGARVELWHLSSLKVNYNNTGIYYNIYYNNIIIYVSIY